MRREEGGVRKLDSDDPANSNSSLLTPHFSLLTPHSLLVHLTSQYSIPFTSAPPMLPIHRRPRSAGLTPEGKRRTLSLNFPISRYATTSAPTRSSKFGK